MIVGHVAAVGSLRVIAWDEIVASLDVTASHSVYEICMFDPEFETFRIQ